MSQRFAVVHEAEADFVIATELADRVLLESIAWLEADLLPHQRGWLSTTDGGKRLSWTGIKSLARAAGIRMHGHFDGDPGLPDAAAARRAIHFLLRSVPNLHGVVLIRDQDDEPRRLQGMEQARRDDRIGIPIVLGLAIVERECWVLSGFDPQDEGETSALELERRELGCDPRTHSHTLAACQDDRALRSAKRVLRSLSGGEWSRESQCWQETPLESLRQRGTENGLKRYLDEIRDRLCPLVGHS